MAGDRGRKTGWILGWSGGFVWVLILSIVFLYQRRTMEATTGFLIAILAEASILFLAPWRFPDTTYRNLMAPIYLLFFLGIAWGVWALGDPGWMGLTWWSLFLLLPLTLPLWLSGGRRWNDEQPGNAA